MANKTVTVRPSGGTYTSLQAAITGEVSANSNLITGLDGILTISIEGTWSSADTTQCEIAGFDSDATHYVNVVTDSANRAGTAIDTGKYRLTASSNPGAIQIVQAYTRVTGLQVRDTTGDGQAAIQIGNVTGVIVDSCLAYSNGWDAFTFSYNNGGGNIFRNCIAIQANQKGFNNRYGTNYVANCIAVRCNQGGIETDGDATTIATNNYSGGNSGADYRLNEGGTFTSTDNYSEDGSLSTTVAAYSTDTFTSVTSDAEDFELPAGSDLIDAGTDLSAAATFPFDWDITGTTRNGTWDVGAYEVQGGATPVELAGVVSATSTATGSLSIPKYLSATVSASSTVIGALSVQKTLSGNVTGSSAVAGLLSTPKYLSGNIQAQSAVSGAIEVSKPLSGVITAQSNASGNIEAIKYLSGTIDVVSIATGDLRTTSGLSGVVLGESSASGSLFVSKYLSGIVSAQSLITGNIQVNKYLSAILTAQSTASGTLSGSADKPGIAHITFVSKTNMMTLSGKSNMITLIGKQNSNSLTGKANNITMGVGDD